MQKLFCSLYPNCYAYYSVIATRFCNYSEARWKLLHESALSSPNCLNHSFFSTSYFLHLSKQTSFQFHDLDNTNWKLSNKMVYKKNIQQYYHLNLLVLYVWFEIFFDKHTSNEFWFWFLWNRQYKRYSYTFLILS